MSYLSEMGEFDELPDDIDDSGKDIGIFHKNELDFGKVLFLNITVTHLSDDLEMAIFEKQGA